MQNSFDIQGLKIVIVNFDPQGPIFADKLLNSVNKHDKVYGEDYILLGWVPGGKDVGGAALANDIHGVFAKDFYGNEINSFQMMDSINDHEDIDLIIDIDWGSGTEAFLYQWVAPHGSKLLAHLTGQMSPTFEPHYNAGNIVGLIIGVRGAAEYELLANRPGIGVATTDVLSTSHLLTVLLVIVGNIIYWSQKRRNT